MLKYLKKNKEIVACIILFFLIYTYGNNMEFYQDSNKCNSSPRKINEPSNEFELDATDDIVLERRDLRQLQSEKIGRMKYDGLDNWPKIPESKGGWWGSSEAVADNLYIETNRLVWPD